MGTVTILCGNGWKWGQSPFFGEWGEWGQPPFFDASGQRIKYSNGATTTFYPTKFYNADSAAATPKITKHIFADSQDIATIEG
ncbi:MAG: hypothetical protein HY005_02205, partial [Candidatus Staskawiczbacteria bacterium]|nr:hypothetical protein [Candidatus Staskawiczbacteria bacterium]